MIAKYLATSLAIEKVVSEPRVIRSCFPISTISMSLVGLESRSTMLPASRAAWVPVFIATPTSACASAGRVVGAVAGHRDQPSALLFPADQRQLVLGLRFGEEVVDAGFLGDRRGRERIVAGDHHGADPHGAEPVEALPHAALDDVLEVDHAEHPACRRCAARPPPAACRPAGRSARRSRPISAGTAPPPSRDPARDGVAGALAQLRTRPCRRRSSGWWPRTARSVIW